LSFFLSDIFSIYCFPHIIKLSRRCYYHPAAGAVADHKLVIRIASHDDADVVIHRPAGGDPHQIAGLSVRP